jgi:hypothetical protein
MSNSRASHRSGYHSAKNTTHEPHPDSLIVLISLAKERRRHANLDESHGPHRRRLSSLSAAKIIALNGEIHCLDTIDRRSDLGTGESLEGQIVRDADDKNALRVPESHQKNPTIRLTLAFGDDR